MQTRFDIFTLSVSQLNEYVRKALAADPMLRKISLRGEISNFKRHSSGHLYFSLRDANARIQCVMFRQDAMRLNIAPADGMNVVLTGNVSIYVRDGSYQFYAEEAQPDGVGALYQEFIRRRDKYTQMGWFDPAVKRGIPKFPRRIGVVTSKSGAVISDIIKTGLARNPGMDLVLFPVAVQGAGADMEIAQGIKTLNATPGVDVIIIGRGGGSMEDLWAFNEEAVINAIHESNLPVVSAIGHETDFTLSDMAADARAATPTAAAVLCVPDIANERQMLASLSNALNMAGRGMLERLHSKVKNYSSALEACSPEKLLEAAKKELDMKTKLLGSAFQIKMTLVEAELKRMAARLTALDPYFPINRGYAVVSIGGKPVNSVHGIKIHDKINIKLSGGEINADVASVYEEDKNGGI